jgi:phosphatidyl-myo-inositol dimannoside synthase
VTLDVPVRAGRSEGSGVRYNSAASSMRVLYLTDSLSDLDGVGRYAVRLIRAIEEERPGFEARVLLSRKHRPTSAEAPARWLAFDPRAESALPPDYFFHMAAPKFWASLVLASWRTFRAARGCDLVHAIKDYPHSFAALLGARWAGVPCVATGHGTYTVQPLLDRRHERRARWCYERFAALIAVSRFTASRLKELLGAEHRSLARMKVVPNAVAADHYAERRPIGERPWHGVRYTLGIGELKERKGHHLALAAWCAVARARPDLHHFVVGKETGDAYERSLRELVELAGLADRVHFLGNVGEDEKIDLLQRAELFLHTPVTSSDGGFEGFGIVYLEASACGIPCVGTLGCGAEDAIDDAVTGFLVAPRPAEVENALAKLLDDAELRRRMGRAGRERAARSTWRDNARSVLAIYDEVLR